MHDLTAVIELGFASWNDRKCFPVVWEQRKFTDYISTVGGGTPSKANPSFWGGNIVWLSSQEIKHPFIDHGTYTITPEAISNSATKMIAADTPLIVYRSGILAHTFPISRPTKDVAINQDIKALIFDHDSLKVQFVVSQLESREQFILHNIVKTGTTVQSVSIPDLNKMPFVRTSIAEQEKIDSLFTNLDKTIALHQRASPVDGPQRLLPSFSKSLTLLQLIFIIWTNEIYQTEIFG